MKILRLPNDQDIQRGSTTDALSLIIIVRSILNTLPSEATPKLAWADGAAEELKIEKIEVFDSKYEVVRQIGEGGFSAVQKVLSKEGNKSFAMKSISLNQLQDACKNDMFHTEIQLLGKLQHENVVCTHEVLQDKTMLHLVMDDCPGNDLFDKLEMCDARLKPSLAVRYVWQMVAGLAFIHERQICHRDICPENYIFSSTDSSAVLKLKDFSLASRKEEMQTLIGTIVYVAPEVLTGKYSRKCDVWSCGLTAFLCCVGRHPVFDINLEGAAMIKRLQDGEVDWKFTSKLDKNLKELFQKMLTKDPSSRISAAELAGNDWLRAQGTKQGGCCTLQ